MTGEDSIQSLKGIGEKTAALFRRVGVETIADLVGYYPRSYDIYEPPTTIRDVREGEIWAVEAVVQGRPRQNQVRNLKILSVVVTDGEQNLKVTWFNMPYLAGQLRPGARYVFRGRVGKKNEQLVMEQPELFTRAAYEEVSGRMRPVYGLTAGLSNHTVVKAVEQALPMVKLFPEFLPPDVRSAYQLAEYNYAVANIHFPADMDAYRKARQRLVFDEFFLFILGLRKLKETSEVSVNRFRMRRISETDKLLRELPYELTNAQKRVWEEIQADMTGEKVMSRLIQGDVGSGKTIIAILALMMTAGCGYQGALMVPTEVLAKQHCLSMQELFERHDLSYRVQLLTGSMTAKEKREAYAAIEQGEIDIVVGTHALIQEKVQYRNLALVVTDEQHRFGVRQRETLSEKGDTPHILVMSATPIPRTLAMIIYGDLDISVIDELPAARLPIKNCVVNIGYRPKAYSFILKEVQKGRQAYIICPMVEESESIEAENVTDYTEKVKSAMPGIRVEYLHGKMKASEKNEIMERFASGDIQVLVSTTVVEVGVNVPNASVMMVENSERFGLAQLHQLRGRVGRGSHQSYCIFVSGNDKKQTMKRLEILNQSNDGFFIAGEDLKLRGPGDLFGIRQSGLMEFAIGDVFTDVDVLKEANEAVTGLLSEDAELEAVEHRPLKKRLDTYLGNGSGMLSI